MKQFIGQTFVCATLADTTQLAQQVWAHAQAGQCLALQGDMGAGKTTFASALIAAAAAQTGQTIAATSPTFSLLHVYPLRPLPIAHGDAYRVRSPEQFIDTGLEEILPTHFTLLEWPQNIAPLLPAIYTTCGA
jgi:tRNA threonylcarbamoyl adenosine modification protein YjeE